MIFMTCANIPEIHGGGNVPPHYQASLDRLCPGGEIGGRLFSCPVGGAGMVASMRPPVYIACLFRHPPTKVCIALLFLLSLLPPRSVTARTGSAPTAVPQTS